MPDPAGDVAEHELAVHDTPVAAFDPKLTVPPDRFVPLIVTGVPPAAGPDDGLTDVTAGAAT